MDNHYVYCITNLINGKKYIGKRTCHCEIQDDNYMGSGINIVKAIKKYGKDSFKKEVLEICSSEKEAYKREREIIESVKAYSNKMYYNVAFGGLGNIKGFQPTRDSITKCLETKKQNGTLPVGEKNGMFGKYNYAKCTRVIVIPEEGDVMHFPSLAEASRKLKIPYSSVHSSCSRGNITAQSKYYFMYEDDFEKIDNKSNFILEKQQSINENRRNMNALQKFYNNRIVYRIDVDTLDILSKYQSIREAAQELGIEVKLIKRNVLHGANSASRGYSFIFADEYNRIQKKDLYKLYHKKEYDGLHKPRLDRKTPIYCLNTSQKFDGVYDAIKYFDLVRGTKIHSVCKGERQYAGKHPNTGEPLVWQYFNDYIKGIYKFYIPKSPKYSNRCVEEIISSYKQKLGLLPK